MHSLGLFQGFHHTRTKPTCMRTYIHTYRYMNMIAALGSIRIRCMHKNIHTYMRIHANTCTWWQPLDLFKGFLHTIHTQKYTYIHTYMRIHTWWQPLDLFWGFLHTIHTQKYTYIHTCEYMHMLAALGSIQRLPRYHGDQLRETKVMTVSWSADHRLLQGSVLARYVYMNMCVRVCVRNISHDCAGHRFLQSSVLARYVCIDVCAKRLCWSQALARLNACKVSIYEYVCAGVCAKQRSWLWAGALITGSCKAQCLQGMCVLMCMCVCVFKCIYIYIYIYIYIERVVDCNNISFAVAGLYALKYVNTHSHTNDTCAGSPTRSSSCWMTPPSCL